MMPSQQCAWISRATQCRLTCITAKVAVGTKIALRPPPHGSRRALLTHRGRRLPTGGLKRRFFLLARLCRPALSRSGGICCSRLLRLIFLHESISLLSHASPRRFVCCTDVKIGMAEGYVALALLKQRRVVPDSLAIGSYPSHFGLTRHAAKIHAERGDHANG